MTATVNPTTGNCKSSPAPLSSSIFVENGFKELFRRNAVMLRGAEIPLLHHAGQLTIYGNSVIIIARHVLFQRLCQG